METKKDCITRFGKNIKKFNVTIILNYKRKVNNTLLKLIYLKITLNNILYIVIFSLFRQM